MKTLSAQNTNPHQSFSQDLTNLKDSFMKSEITLDDFKQELQKINQRISDENLRSITGNKINYSELVRNLEFDSMSDGQKPDFNHFSKSVEIAIITNNDSFLSAALQNNPSLISQIEDQRHFINLAVEMKSTHTFDILLDSGFDPMKKGAHTISPIALAARSQSNSFLESYCRKISEKFGEAPIKDLINEKDAEGKNAFYHAVEGRSYSSIIKFLLENGADTSHDFQPLAELAIENRHIETLDFLLKQNKAALTEKALSYLSDFALERDNHIAQNVLAVNSGQFSRALQKINQAIDNHRNDHGSDTDIYKICAEGSLPDFKFLTEVLKARGETLFLNQSDENGKITPLYDEEKKSALFYAINGNCYSKLVLVLLENGAVLTDLVDQDLLHLKEFTRSNGEGIDALTLCIRKKEPETLGMILGHKAIDQTFDGNLILDNEKLGEIVQEMISQEYLNAKIVKSFFDNISKDRLTNLPEETLIDLVKTALDITPLAVSDKIEKSFAGDIRALKIDKIFSQESQINANPTLIKAIKSLFPQVNSASQKASRSSAARSDYSVNSENTRLLSDHPTYGEATGTEAEAGQRPSTSICGKIYNIVLDCFGGQRDR